MAASCALPAWAVEPAADDGVVRFDIARFDVSGNTLLPPQQIEQLLAPFTGKTRDFGDVQRALEALEAAYHARGYSVVTIELPEQELNRGVVMLRVVETRIGRVSVKGNRYFDEANIRRSLPALLEGRTPNLKAVSANLKQANESPSKQVTLKLQGSDTDGEVDAMLDVKDESAWKAMANADNTGTEQTGKTHLGFILQHANLFGRDHLASLQYTTSAGEPGRVKVYGAGYIFRCTSRAIRWTFSPAIPTSIPAPSPPAPSTWPSADVARSTAHATTRRWPNAASSNRI